MRIIVRRLGAFLLGLVIGPVIGLALAMATPFWLAAQGEETEK